MVDEVQYLCDRLEALISSAIQILQDGTTPERENRLAAVRRAIETLRSRGLPVPPDVLVIHDSLTDTQAAKAASAQALHVVRNRIADTNAQIGSRRRGPSAGRNGVRKKVRVEGATPLSAYREAITEALRELGGSASTAAVREKVFAIMQERLLPNDFLRQATTGEVLWRYRFSWAGHLLRDEGVLRRGSPRGLWELAALPRERTEESNDR